jgi:hypothetical protein
MRRIARVTEDLGCDGGGFYVKAPDIPEGLSCDEWRRRPSFGLPAIRPQGAFPRPALGRATP